MDFDYSARTLELANRLGAFMREEVAPRDAEWRASAQKGTFPLVPVDDLKRRARALGLWNLFLPSLREDQPGTRLTNLEYAPLAEMTGRIPWSPEVFNCNSPDSGNMEILQLCATPEQRERWLNPLLDGAIRSCFSMSEPATASSDPTNLQTTIRRDGDHYHVRGRKWFSTGARHPNCRFSIVMGRTYSDEAGETHKRYSMIIVPFETPGLNIIRDVSIMNHHSPEGHCEIDFDVRVPAANLLGQEGEGFTIAQARLGPGRIHHCMRTIGQCELALEMMVARAKKRIAFGSALAEYANIQDWIAESRIEIDQARLLVLRAAWLMDKAGNKAARVDVSAIKIVAARLQTRILDRAIQLFGADWPHRGYAARLPMDLGARAPVHRWHGRSPFANGRPRGAEEVDSCSLIDRGREQQGHSRSRRARISFHSRLRPDSLHIGRVAGLLAGLPQSSVGAPVNRWCGSSIQAVQVAGGMILMGAGDAFVAGGTESMSRVWMLGFNVMPPPSWSQQEVLDFIK